MQADYQSPESPVAAIDGTYSYTEAASLSLERLHRSKIAPEFFRYRVVKRCMGVALRRRVACQRLEGTWSHFGLHGARFT